jgi:hypothetical protein
MEIVSFFNHAVNTKMPSLRHATRWMHPDFKKRVTTVFPIGSTKKCPCLGIDISQAFQEDLPPSADGLQYFLSTKQDYKQSDIDTMYDTTRRITTYTTSVNVTCPGVLAFLNTLYSESLTHVIQKPDTAMDANMTTMYVEPIKMYPGSFGKKKQPNHHDRMRQEDFYI